MCNKEGNAERIFIATLSDFYSHYNSFSQFLYQVITINIMASNIYMATF